MNLEVIRAELESEIAWRQDEIRFLRNQLIGLAPEAEGDRFRRALVLVLYSHYEGFCKFALQRYVIAINRLGIVCREVRAEVVAGAWSRVFGALEDPSRKSKMFKRALPDDTKLHRFARRRDFVEQLAEFENLRVEIPEDVVDVESNLWPDVLKKNLFKLGLEPDCFSKHDKPIRRLLNRRNSIAHGADRAGLEEKEYKELEEAVFTIFEEMMDIVMAALGNEQFRKAS